MLTLTSLRLDHGNWGDTPRESLTERTHPTFDWAAFSDTRTDCQTAYRAAVYDDDTPLWETGWIKSETQSCAYTGTPLPTDRALRFSVQIQNRRGELSAPLSRTFYRVCTDFPHTFIADPNPAHEGPDAPAVWFVRRFTPEKPVREAVLYACGIGYQQVELNGRPVSAACLDPLVSDYRKRFYMAVIPALTDALCDGENVLRIGVANGWRNPDDTYFRLNGETFFFGRLSLTAALHLCYTDGSETWIHTGTDWDCTAHPCTRARLFGGETYDARVNTTAAQPAAVVDGPGGKPAPMTLPPITIHETYRPLTVTCLAPGKFLADFGQNVAGVCRLTLPAGLTAGSEVVLTHAEEIGEDGDLSFATMRFAASRDVYVAAGDDRDLTVWQPHFTYHGFRYVRIEGLPLVTPETITALCLRTAAPEIGDFRCGSALINAVHRAAVNSERDNMTGILTDCPQRDERMGWFNDATVRFEETPYNFDIGRLFPKIIEDVRDQQSPEDGSITCTAPFIYGSRPADPVCSSYLVAGEQSYLFTGNRELLAHAYDGFARWEACLASLAKEDIITYSCYGDWAGPVYACVDGDKTIDATHSLLVPDALMSTGYYYYNARLLSRMAGWLARPQEKQHYAAMADRIRDAMLREWWHPETATIANGSQGCQSFALWLGILPAEYRREAARRIHEDLVTRDYRITTGNLCTRYLLDALSQNGYEDDAYALLTREEYPSIGFMLQQEATTVWERFELKKEPGMNSHNHPMYGSVDYWMYAYAAGIRPTAAGFDCVSVEPVYPKKLQSAHATLQTVKGPLTVRWIRRFGQIELRVEVPFGVSAAIRVGSRTETVGSGLWCYTLS